jgi:hypothetical protein
MTIAFLGEPRRHVAAACGRDHGVDALQDVFIAQQRKGGGPTGVVAGSAVFIEDGGDVVAEGRDGVGLGDYGAQG